MPRACPDMPEELWKQPSEGVENGSGRQVEGEQNWRGEGQPLHGPEMPAEDLAISKNPDHHTSPRGGEETPLVSHTPVS